MIENAIRPAVNEIPRLTLGSSKSHDLAESSKPEATMKLLARSPLARNAGFPKKESPSLPRANRAPPNAHIV